ncbi:acyl-CoA dehydrogenase [Rhodothermus profundi]|uniref:Acyl-coenzyme A dehydrogenase n=1 Tax=Rhodothermus profundi TaxID=633813 RepID=A0A1M6VB53_9BACT|nr:acyl-CoA dehydrogenase [Rhodothermus profundi]SHK78585.1 acyl-CoA dehydrogenase [Rhodothermus profundi]
MNLPFYHFLEAVGAGWIVLGVLVVALVLAFTGAPLALWTLATALVLYGVGAPGWLWAVFGVLAVIFNLKPLRQTLVSKPLMSLMRASGFLPKISDTERTAIEAGTVWVEGELFAGKPNFHRLLRETNYPSLTEEERAFLEGPVEELCRMVDDWEVWRRRDLPPEVWQFIREKGFLGIIIPKEYGGLGFSALANSAIVQKLASRCGPLATTVMVPNSLGPAELLIHYGTQAQRDYYLPRLARGEEIPAFALTEPGAGSDAGAIQASGVVFRGEDGKLYIRLNFQKRYITLAAIATVLGLAFKLRDPENLLGKGEDVGITCALIPTNTPGVKLGMRHDPLGVPFYNCPVEGHDVVVPIDAIIGGPEWAGKGWRMLMESLAAGRGISLPASSAGGVKLIYRVTSAHAKVRRQFGLPIGVFEGIEEPLARIGGFNYLIEASRVYTCGGLDRGAKPAVVSAIMKYNTTELARQAINDGMDILGGNGISRGPRNLLAHGYIATPIGITVEGANILTRTLMIFGQGAIRCHPYAYKEISALEQGDVKAFDQAFWKHVGLVIRNGARALLLSLSRGRLARTGVSGPAARYARKLAWASATFAFLADLAMASLGGNLKRKEKLTGRFADIFSWMYLAAATMRRFEAEGRREEDRPFFDWAMQYAFARMQQAFDGLFDNLRIPGLTWFLRGPAAWWSRLNRLSTPPSDALGHRVVQRMLTPGEQRERMTAGMYVPSDPNEALGRLERAFQLAYQEDELLKKVYAALKRGELTKARPEQMVRQAVEKGILTAEEARIIQEAEAARWDAIQVDAFTLEEYQRYYNAPPAGIEPAGDGSHEAVTTPS